MNEANRQQKQEQPAIASLPDSSQFSGISNWMVGPDDRVAKRSVDLLFCWRILFGFPLGLPVLTLSQSRGQISW